MRFGKFAVLHVEIPDPKNIYKKLHLCHWFWQLLIDKQIEFQLVSSTLNGCTHFSAGLVERIWCTKQLVWQGSWPHSCHSCLMRPGTTKQLVTAFFFSKINSNMF